MTPERIAAARIARTVEREAGFRPGAAEAVGLRAVEAISAAGLVIVPAERIAALMAMPREGAGA